MSPMYRPRSAATLGALLVGLAHGAEAAEWHVPADHATLQDAVDAAQSGDTIHLAPGVYVEQTWITKKDLTLIGQPGTILRAFPGMEPGIPGVVRGHHVLFITESSNVTLRNLTFEGDQLADQNEPALLGVGFDLSGGQVENCRFTGFREKTPGSSSADGGLAIKFWNGYDNARRYVAKVSGTTIEDCYSGIYINGAKHVSYDVTLVDNTVTGVGLATTADPQVGIDISGGTAGLTARNTIRGFAYDGEIGPPNGHQLSFGVVRLGSGFPDDTQRIDPMTFEDNVFRDNQVHLAFFKADGSVVRNNLFDGNVPFLVNEPPRLQAPAGLWFSGANVQVTGNQFRDLEQGIRLAANDPFGTATEAMLIDNTFCDVATRLTTEPGADSVEQGSRVCPFPDPELVSERAVILTWPWYYESHRLERAPSLDGPWSVVDATPVVRDGKTWVAVPATSGAGLFRLRNP